MNAIIPLIGLVAFALAKGAKAGAPTSMPTPKPPKPPPRPPTIEPGASSPMPTTPSDVPWPTPTTVPVAPPGMPPGAHPVLRRGMRGAEVLDWQNFLGAKALDGIFGDETERLVRAYQTSRALQVDGVIGAATWAARDANRPQIAPRQDAPGPAAAPPPPAPSPGPVSTYTAPPAPAAGHPVLRLGSKGAAVLDWQNFLGAKALDGQFGPETLALVKAYQISRKLTSDGVIGPATWAARDAGTPVIVPPAAAAPPNPVTPVQAMPTPDGGTVYVPVTPTTGPALAERERGTIKKGSKGADVVEWQTFLGLHADGIFGPETDTFTKRFQTQQGLKADGIVGPKTWAAARAKASS